MRGAIVGLRWTGWAGPCRLEGGDLRGVGETGGGGGVLGQPGGGGGVLRQGAAAVGGGRLDQVFFPNFAGRVWQVVVGVILRLGVVGAGGRRPRLRPRAAR